MKSNKKLFAILTLTMFMMTLLPMAAFGAVGYSAAASEVKASNTSVGIYTDADDLAKITVTLKTSAGVPAAGKDFYVISDRDAEEGFVSAAGLADVTLSSAALSSLAGQGFVTGTDGKAIIYVGSKVTGTFKISVYDNTGGADVKDGILIGSANVSVSVGDGNVSLEALDKSGNINLAGPVAKNATATAASQTAGTGITLLAKVFDGASEIEDAPVTFQAKYGGGSWYNIATDVTDENGEAEFYFEETKIGDYQYRAKSDDENSGVITIPVIAATIKTIELKTADGTKIAKDQNNNIDFYVKDKYGNLQKTGTWVVGDFEYEVVSAPEGSKFEDVDFGDSITGLDFKNDKIADGVLRLTFKPDKVGSYTLKVRHDTETRVTQTITVEAIKFDDAVSLAFVLENWQNKEVTELVRNYEASQAVNYYTERDLVAGELIVKMVNADGVKLTAPTADLKYASSNTSHVGIDGSGNITVKKDAIGTYDITVHYAPDNLVGVYTLKVVGGAVALKATPVVNGTSAAVTLQYVDKNGDNTYTNETTDEGFTISVPSGVTASNVKDINKIGKGTFDLKATQAGTYNITVITHAKRLAVTFPVTFGVDAGTAPAYGAQKVTMFIGATGYVSDGSPLVTDVAPFIVDGRTFVAVRPVADAFGCEIGWNEATQTVTLTRADKVVTIVIGSNVITVVEGGVTSTITADVAAFIKDGRTVLPFRAVGDAFGATVEYDATTQAVTYEQ